MGEVFESYEDEVITLRQRVKELEAENKAIVNVFHEIGAAIESIEDALDGKEVSDFMGSYPIVRRIIDLKQQAESAQAAVEAMEKITETHNSPLDVFEFNSFVVGTLENYQQATKEGK